MPLHLLIVEDSVLFQLFSSSQYQIFLEGPHHGLLKLILDHGLGHN